MFALEVNTRSPKKGSISPVLEIRIHFADGSKDTFVQPDAEISESILQQINPSHLFTQTRIVIVDDYSKSVFVYSQISFDSGVDDTRTVCGLRNFCSKNPHSDPAYDENEFSLHCCFSCRDDTGRIRVTLNVAMVK
jgi:hypothetical protein